MLFEFTEHAEAHRVFAIVELARVDCNLAIGYLLFFVAQDVALRNALQDLKLSFLHFCVEGRWRLQLYFGNFWVNATPLLRLELLDLPLQVVGHHTARGFQLLVIGAEVLPERKINLALNLGR